MPAYQLGSSNTPVGPEIRSTTPRLRGARGPKPRHGLVKPLLLKLGEDTRIRIARLQGTWQQKAGLSYPPSMAEVIRIALEMADASESGRKANLPWKAGNTWGVVMPSTPSAGRERGQSAAAPVIPPAAPKPPKAAAPPKPVKRPKPTPPPRVVPAPETPVVEAAEEEEILIPSPKPPRPKKTRAAAATAAAAPVEQPAFDVAAEVQAAEGAAVRAQVIRRKGREATAPPEQLSASICRDLTEAHNKLVQRMLEFDSARDSYNRSTKGLLDLQMAEERVYGLIAELERERLRWLREVPEEARNHFISALEVVKAARAGKVYKFAHASLDPDGKHPGLLPPAEAAHEQLVEWRVALCGERREGIEGVRA